MKVNMILAVSENGCLGKDNKLIWKLSNDLKRFKELTTNKTVIMGRKTYVSIGKPLPNRINIIISKTETNIEECFVFDDINKALEYAKTLNNDIFIIGGGEIYKSMIDITDCIYLTRVLTKIDGDTFFDLSSLNNFKLDNYEYFVANNKNEYNFIFEKYIKY